MAAPVANSGRDFTLKITLPSPPGGFVFGGKNPANGACVGCGVIGSSELKVQVINPVLVSNLPTTLATRFRAGRRSTSCVNVLSPGVGITVCAPKATGPKLNVLRST